MKKAIYLDSIAGKEVSLEEKLRVAKDAGFDGVEIPTIEADSEIKAIKRVADAQGLKIHSIMNAGHWQNPLSSPDAAVRKKCKAGIRRSIDNAAFVGADAVLVVPAVVTDEVSYEDAYKRSREEIGELAQDAVKAKVFLLVENVWNKFLLSPTEFSRYVDEFKCPYVAAYFDVGNIMAYGYPHHWILTLGKRIKKIHVKDFRVKEHAFVYLLEGDVPWAKVMRALKQVGYDGYLTAELFPPYPTASTQTAYDASVHLDRIMKLA